MARRLEWTIALCAAIWASAVGATCSATNPATGFGDVGGAGPGATGSTTGAGGNPTLAGAGGSDAGLFDAPMQSDGKGGDCDPSCKAAGGSCIAGVCNLVDDPGKLDPATKASLEGGGKADPAFAWLYPYDKTVFPRGLIAPTLQFSGAAVDAVYVHVTFSGLDYKGYYGASNPPRAAFTDPMWKAITLAAQGSDSVKVEVTKTAGMQVSGPITEEWSIAQGNLRGTIYYETYGSMLAGGLGSVGIMKIAPGAAQPVVMKSGCGNVCHTASADGSTLVASTAFPFGSSSYDLKNNAAVIKAQPDNSFTYGGIYPDGSFVVSATNYRTWLGGPSLVYDAVTGVQIAMPSWETIVKNAGTPAFSPDGKWIAFNNEDTGAGHTLATMNYDPGTKTFANLKLLATDVQYTGWPAFTPDSKSVIYHAGSNAVFETDNNETGDLFIVNVATKKIGRLDQLDGYDSGKVYLPANDAQLSFAPTVLPEAVGGYFWTVFTSHRSYGNMLPTKDNADQNGKLWVSAIDLAPKDGVDPSHPAFYLDGQESGADNLRGFWVLDPCQKDGTDCLSGDQCCGGFCRQAEDGGAFTCAPMVSGCSNVYEKCTTSADCCDAGDQCINGHCAAPPPK